jgi:hypothetical protein
MKKRTITLELPGDISATDYAELASAAWMLLRISRSSDGFVVHDGKAGSAELNDAWERYAKEVRWRS